LKLKLQSLKSPSKEVPDSGFWLLAYIWKVHFLQQQEYPVRAFEGKSDLHCGKCADRWKYSAVQWFHRLKVQLQSLKSPSKVAASEPRGVSAAALHYSIEGGDLADIFRASNYGRTPLLLKAEAMLSTFFDPSPSYNQPTL
jgi:hypothetical protein